jgi:hypothetical protein
MITRPKRRKKVKDGRKFENYFDRVAAAECWTIQTERHVLIDICRDLVENGDVSFSLLARAVEDRRVT